VKILYTAAHGGFAAERVPLGGGAAVFEMLRRAWPDVAPIVPSAVTGRELVSFSEWEYAAFCRRFEAESTAAILRNEAKDCVVLVNDISEGPDFARLAAAGYRVFVIFHVDVVAYVAAIYGRGWVAPERLVRWHERWERFCPDVLQLVFQKQRDCVRHATACLVPSPAMREVIHRCYGPQVRVEVLPWGTPSTVYTSARRPAEKKLTLLTLSRISPEKNQHVLLEALLAWEQQGLLPSMRLRICGQPAFMRGQAYFEKLKALADQLRQVEVEFPGHVTGQAKADQFAEADLYVFPSSHESYGLTLMEAFAAGLPALTLDHAGARGVMRADFGRMASPDGFLPALQELTRDRARLREMGRAAQAYALAHPFSATAERLRALLLGGA
jgi:glycosyltransferase involved in cell wall biosynthesis